MTGQDIQERLDALVLDMQINGKGKTVQIAFRDSTNQTSIYSLSADLAGVVSAADLADVQNYVDTLKTAAETYNTATAPYTAKAAELRVISESPVYQAAKTAYNSQNVSENYGELANAKGAYVI